MAAGDEEGGGGADGSAVSLDESAATKSRWRIRPYGPLREHQLLPRLARGGKLFFWAFGNLEVTFNPTRGCKTGLFSIENSSRHLGGILGVALSWEGRERARAQKAERRAISCALSLKSKMSRSSWLELELGVRG